MKISPKQPHIAEQSVEWRLERVLQKRKMPLLLGMFILQVAESKGIIYVIVCSGAQNFYYMTLARCVFFFTGRYVGAMFRFIWGSFSLECILKAKLSWRVMAGNAFVCLLRESKTLRCCKDWWNYLFLCLSSLLGFKCV